MLVDLLRSALSEVFFICSLFLRGGNTVGCDFFRRVFLLAWNKGSRVRFIESVISESRFLPIFTANRYFRRKRKEVFLCQLELLMPFGKGI